MAINWIRLDTNFFIKDKIRYVTLVTRYAVIAVIAYVKQFGVGGIAEGTIKEIAYFSDIPEENIKEALTIDMFKVEGKKIQVVKWQEYQIDSSNAERQKKHRDKKKSNSYVTLRNESNDYSTLHYINPPTPLKGAEEALAMLIKTSDYGHQMRMDEWTLAKVRRALEDYKWEQVQAAIVAVGQRAKGWGLIEAELAKRKADQLAADDSRQLTQRAAEETRNYIRSIKEKCGIAQ